MKNQNSSSFVNKFSYSSPDVIKYYQETETLFKTEKILFEKLIPKIQNKKILDIGIGGGRTTRYLSQISNDYIGVDYVAEFAEETSKKYPDAQILCGDARNLKDFADETFDFVLFSYNGLDAISSEDRLKALKEIYRTLKKGGIFMFSSHNRNYKYFNRLPWRRKIEYDLSFVRFFMYCLYHLPKHLKMKKYEICTDDFAIVNDPDHRYSMLIYYICIEKQVKQLANIGFFDVEAYDFEGRLVDHDLSSNWIYYLAKKT